LVIKEHINLNTLIAVFVPLYFVLWLIFIEIYGGLMDLLPRLATKGVIPHFPPAGGSYPYYKQEMPDRGPA